MKCDLPSVIIVRTSKKVAEFSRLGFPSPWISGRRRHQVVLNTRRRAHLRKAAATRKDELVAAAAFLIDLCEVFATLIRYRRRNA